MSTRGAAFVAALLLVGGVLGTAGLAGATVTMDGNVRVWNPITSLYQPLPHARVRLVLQEYWDTDTLDVEGSTDASGHYRVTKGNAWWRDGYDAYLIVFAEVPNKLEIQTHWGQIDGYQAVSSGYYAHDNRTTTRDLSIGGPSDNCSRYQVGGVAALGNADTCNSTRGARAFVLCHEMTDHRVMLVADALGEGNFEEKEVSYPVDAAVANYTDVLDYIRFPDSYFTSSDKARISETARHELSHGIMADEYWTWPGWTYGSFGSHTLNTVAAHREWAWSEAWAEFMAEVTHRPRYGAYNDFETPDSGWRGGIPAGADHSKVEGEIASAMWDIYDGAGWEKRSEQEAAIPGEEKFYDGISDGDLVKIWDIFRDDHPHSFTHESYAGSADSFVHYWLGRGSYGLRHELKAICYNRGINPPEFSQHRPTVTVGAVTWSGNTARVPVTVTESDAEDRTRVRLELFVNDTKTYSQWLTDGWSGATNSRTVDQEIAWISGQPRPRLVVAVHDDMQASSRALTLDPPAGASVGALVAEVLAVSVRRNSSPSWLGNDGPSEWLRDVAVSVEVRNGTANRTTRMPATGGYTVPGDGEFRDEADREIYRANGVPPYLELAFTTTGRDGGQNFSQNYLKRYTPADNCGLGIHSEVIMQRHRQQDLMWLMHVDIDTRVEVLYRVRAATPTYQLVLSSALRAAMLAPAMQPVGALKPVGTLKPGAALARRDLVRLNTGALAGQETPTVLLSRAQQLLDEQARLQAEALEAASELEWRLTPPPPVAGPRGARVLKVKPGGPNQVLLRRDLLTPSGVLSIPTSKFLEDAAGGRVALAKINPEQRGELALLQQQITQRETRLAELEKLSGQLQVSLNTALTKISQEPGAGQLQGVAGVPLKLALTRLNAVGPSMAPTRNLLLKQRQVIDRSLASPQ